MLSLGILLQQTVEMEVRHVNRKGWRECKIKGTAHAVSIGQIFVII